MLYFFLEKFDSVLFQIKYLCFNGKLIPRSKSYGNADIHTKSGIDDLGLLKMFSENDCDVIYHKQYFTHKTKLITFLDKCIFKSLPQFSFLVKLRE